MENAIELRNTVHKHLIWVEVKLVSKLMRVGVRVMIEAEKEGIDSKLFRK